jgi:hypothetical protein
MLVALVRLLLMTDKPALCTGIYAAVEIAIRIFSGNPAMVIAISAGISIIVFGLYFWLLNRFHSGLLYWLIFLVGLPICLII